MRTLYFAIIGVLLTSCSTGQYQAPEEGNLATISFSNLSVEMPSISIGEPCSLMQVNRELIERKSPSDRSLHKTNIVADRETALNIKYSWLGQEIFTLENKGGILEHKTTKEVAHCNETVVFYPAANKHYEAYFGVTKDQCFIKVVESETIYKSTKKRLRKISTKASGKC